MWMPDPRGLNKQGLFLRLVISVYAWRIWYVRVTLVICPSCLTASLPSIFGSLSGLVFAVNVTTLQTASRCECGMKMMTLSLVWSRSSNESPTTSSVKPSSRSALWAERWTSGIIWVSWIGTTPFSLYTAPFNILDLITHHFFPTQTWWLCFCVFCALHRQTYWQIRCVWGHPHAHKCRDQRRGNGCSVSCSVHLSARGKLAFYLWVNMHLKRVNASQPLCF